MPPAPFSTSQLAEVLEQWLRWADGWLSAVPPPVAAKVPGSAAGATVTGPAQVQVDEAEQADEAGWSDNREN